MNLNMKAFIFILTSSCFAGNALAANACLDSVFRRQLVIKSDESLDLTNQTIRRSIENAGSLLNLKEKRFPYVKIKTKDGSTRHLLIVGKDERSIQLVEVLNLVELENQLADIGDISKDRDARLRTDLENLKNLKNLINFDFKAENFRKDQLLSFSMSWYGIADSFVNHGLALKKAIDENKQENIDFNTSSIWSQLFLFNSLIKEIENSVGVSSEEILKMKRQIISYLVLRLEGWNVDQGVLADEKIYENNLNVFKHKKLKLDKFDKNEKQISMNEMVEIIQNDLLNNARGLDLLIKPKPIVRTEPL